VLLCDAGPRRNAAAQHIHNFVTRDGTPPDELRQIGRAQLATYPNVETRDVGVESIAGSSGAFRVGLPSEVVEARRVLLCTGMIDEMLPIDGFRERWGRAIFQCPHCHGWEAQDRRWGYLARDADARMFVAFALQLRGWTSDVVVFTSGAFEVAPEAREQLRAAGIRLETAPIARLAGREHRLEAVELAGGTAVPCEVLFAHPPQRQVDVVRALGVELDDDGYVRIDPMKRETSVAGIYAAGDLTTRMQGAVIAAAAGVQAAAMINHELTAELATTGGLPIGDSQPNRDQASYWNEQAGPRWVAMQRDLDAQLEPFGLAAARALAVVSGHRVLDVGCGAGATSVMLAERARPGQVVGIDISGPLLARARQRAEAIENLRFEQADAQTFAFSGAAYDAVFSRFGVMFFADPIAAFRNLRTALRPEGRLGFVCWRALRDNPSFVVPLAAALPYLPEAPPAPEPGAPGPFAFADEDRVRAILDRAGYADIDIAPHDTDLVLAGGGDLEAAVDLAMQIGPLARAASALAEATRARVRDAVRDAFVPHHKPSGVTLPAATWIVTARRAS
jgi:thioredoxin reductase/SAM-dependent methyltransferase